MSISGVGGSEAIASTGFMARSASGTSSLESLFEKQKLQADLEKGDETGSDLPEAKEEKTSEEMQNELQRKALLTYMEQYRQSYGAPEELDRDRVIPEDPDEDEEEKKADFNPNALETRGDTVEDPEDPGKVKVYVTQYDEKGIGHITRSFNIDVGEGEKTGKLPGQTNGEKTDGSMSVMDEDKRKGFYV